MTTTSAPYSATPGGRPPQTPPFGQMVTAMITPMNPGGTVDYDGAARLADYLVTDMRNDGLVVNGTTGEAPTTTDDEKERLLQVVLEAVGSRARVVAGVGTNVTEHTIELARTAERVGGHGLLVAAVATETLARLAAHPRIVGVKDAKDAPGATSHVLARTDLVYYCGTDMLNLPWLSLGAVGFISVVGHVVGDRLHEMIDAFGAGDVARARQIHYELIPVYDGLFRNQGAVMAKAALDLLGLPGGAVRLPLLAATDAERHQLALDLTAGGIKLPGTGLPGTGA